MLAITYPSKIEFFTKKNKMKIPITNNTLRGHKPSFKLFEHSFLAKQTKKIIVKNITRDKLILNTADKPKQLSYPPEAAGQCK